MDENQPIVCAYHFVDGKVEELTPEAAHKIEQGPGWHWFHLDRTKPGAEAWLSDVAGLDPVVVEALSAEETRPRSTDFGSGLQVNLRGVNLNPGAEPDDMISARIWIDEKRVITLRADKLKAIQDEREAIEGGELPGSPGELLVEIARRIVSRIGPVLENLDDTVAQIEESVLDAPSMNLRVELSRMRRQAINLRRFVSPQRDALTLLQSERTPLLTDADRTRLREVQDRLSRYVEELDSARDRAAVTQEELAGRISDQMNKNMYVLSLVAGIFLPLGLLTGLLGINVGGIPGQENASAFAIVCAMLVLMGIGVILLFKRMRLW